MQITEIKENTKIRNESYKPTWESLDGAHSYLIAQQLTGKLLGLGLITEEEYDKIMLKNVASFMPEIASLYH